MTSNFTWLDILQLGVFTAVFTQILGFGIEQLKSRFADRREARTIALLVAVSLEKFAIDCANVIAANDMFRTSEGHAGRRTTAIPQFPDLMPSTVWKVLDPALAARAATMPNERILGEGRIEFAWEINGEHDDATGATDIECGKCGYLAWTIAKDFRARYKLPPIDVDVLSWDFTRVLRDEFDYAMKLIGKRHGSRPKAP